MLLDPLPQTLTGLDNILLTTPSHPTADGIAYIADVAVHLSFQVNDEAGGSGLEGLSRLDIGADWTSLSTLLHARSHSSWPSGWGWWYLGPPKMMCMENNAKFSGHYVRQRTHNVRAHALRSDQLSHLTNQCFHIIIMFFIKDGTS